MYMPYVGIYNVARWADYEIAAPAECMYMCVCNYVRVSCMCIY